eukprot:CAMPEP_0172318474 /NCGR_PEP_ID=MMETSP1058-20130122/34980_1 /TAXON_ID=83371 /ORGANISM="Detonula confervacea, Strain CCMP 353" /LENGTH=978 /DNA_ID=CAMNT_0013033317 /DNA_START=104 /DNA_END=3040 /DNA_ORIENTATION=+
MTAPASIDGGIAMPSYNIRHSIATKVAAKKTAKGYTLSEESCVMCEMSLMTLNGKSECKVCPAIKKWVQRKNEATAVKEVDDVREVVETVEKESEIRDEAPIISVESYEKSQLEDADSDEKYELLENKDNRIDSLESYEKSNLEDVDSYENSELLENKDSAIDYLESYEKSELEDADSDEKPELLENEDTMDYESAAERFGDMKVSKSESMESEASTRDYLSRSESDESEDTDAIRARAKQIILNARGRGEWGSDSNDSNLSWDDERMTFSRESIEESMIQERAGEIINQARKNLQAEEGLNFPPESILSPRVASTDLASVEENNPGMGSWEAAIIIQSVARRSLAKKLFLGMIRESDECHQDEEVIDELMHQDEEVIEEMTEQASSGHFEPLGVNNPTGDDKKDCAPAEETGEVQAQQNEDLLGDVGEEHVAHDTAQSGDVANFDNTQYTEDPNMAGNDTDIAVGQEPETITEEVPQAENVMTPQMKEVSISEYAGVQQKQDMPKTAPSRGFFAGLACKFDDAVTDAMGKVHSIVTCSATADGGGFEGFGDAFEAQQSKYKSIYDEVLVATSSSGIVKYDSQTSLTGQANYEGQTMLLAMRGWKIANAACHHCNKLLMMRPEDGQLMCAGCETVETEPMPMAVPTRLEHDVNHAPLHQGPDVHRAPLRPEYAVNHASPRPESVVNHDVPNHLYNIELNRRLQLGWLAMNHGCPYCNSQLMRKPNDDTDHCLACGPIFTQPAHIATPSMPTFTSYTPNNIHQNIHANPLRDVTAAHYGSPESTVMPANASNSAPPAPPVQNYDPRDECARTPKQHQVMTPNHNQMMQMMLNAPMDKWAQDDDAKENAFGDANISKQLMDAKLRIEDAKKFIISRNTRRTTPSSQSVQPLINNMTGPGTQANIFRPQVNMTTPGAQTYHNVGSLMSPGTESSAHHASKMGIMSPGNQASVNAAQMSMTTPGTPNSGYRTPQMPGKYFFA